MADFIKEPGDIEVKYGASHQGVWKVIICRQTIRYDYPRQNRISI